MTIDIHGLRLLFTSEWYTPLTIDAPSPKNCDLILTGVGEPYGDDVLVHFNGADEQKVMRHVAGSGGLVIHAGGVRYVWMGSHAHSGRRGAFEVREV